ncbi:MAG: hypothetical protein GY841_14230 [FCB group bacterium]|nr:hypothetical protein [FCB group bacterium]
MALLKIRKQIEKIENKILFPALRKKYEGRFFKYVNRAEDENWNYYSKCIKVIDEKQGIFNSFEITSEEHRFSLKHTCFFFICEKEISEKEYLDALNVFKKQLNSI